MRSLSGGHAHAAHGWHLRMGTLMALRRPRPGQGLYAPAQGSQLRYFGPARARRRERALDTLPVCAWRRQTCGGRGRGCVAWGRRSVLQEEERCRRHEPGTWWWAERGASGANTGTRLASARAASLQRSFSLYLRYYCRSSITHADDGEYGTDELKSIQIDKNPRRRAD